mmetsp:Transcript_14011/g.19630  ORF Transcript_14011/g.19630 Transcript_14011/m.19630 type:complete len:84 (-) Transcript_14011:182-433(-)
MVATGTAVIVAEAGSAPKPGLAESCLIAADTYTGLSSMRSPYPAVVVVVVVAAAVAVDVASVAAGAAVGIGGGGGEFCRTHLE